MNAANIHARPSLLAEIGSLEWDSAGRPADSARRLGPDWLEHQLLATRAKCPEAASSPTITTSGPGGRHDRHRTGPGRAHDQGLPPRRPARRLHLQHPDSGRPPDPRQTRQHLPQRIGPPNGVGIRHPLSVCLREARALFESEGEPPARRERLRYLLKQRLFFGKARIVSNRSTTSNGPGGIGGNLRDLEATGKVAGTLTCDVNGAGAEIHPQVCATQFLSDEPSWTANSAAEVQLRDAAQRRPHPRGPESLRRA